MFGAAWQHDGAARGPKPVGRGTCFVVVGIVVELPFLTRPVCLPVMTRLWRPKTGPSKVELAASMVKLLAVCLNRPLHVVADTAYHGRALRHLPEAITLTTRCRPAPCCSTSRRRPRSAAALASRAPGWARPPNSRRPPRSRPRASPGTAAPTRSGSPRPMPLVRLLPHPDRPRHPDPRRGHHHRPRPGLVTTDPATPAAALVTRYAWRWSIETTFAEARTLLGVGQARNRSGNAVRALSRSACTATRSPSSGTRCTATIPATPPTTAHGPPGTPPRPTRPSPTCSPSSAA